MTNIGLGVVMFMCAVPSGAAKEITRDQARQLVLKVLDAQRTPTKSPRFDLEENTGATKYFPGFYFFDAYFDTPTRLATVGSYAVNRKTADVWESIGCHRLNPPAISPLQKSLRKEIGLSELEDRKFSAIAPCSVN